MAQKIYCGPTLPAGRLSAYAVYLDDLPETVKSVIEECPEAGKLIVPIERLSEVRRKCAESGTEENRLYKAVKNHKWEANS